MKKLVGTLIAIALLTSTAAAQTEVFGSWMHVPRIDRITDENRSSITAEASEYPEYATLAALLIRCDVLARTGVEVFFYADRYLGIEDWLDVAYRLDGNTAVHRIWGASTNREAVFSPEGGVSSFLAALDGANELVFRISTRTRDYTYVVPVNGFRNALDALGCYTGEL